MSFFIDLNFYPRWFWFVHFIQMLLKCAAIASCDLEIIFLFRQTKIALDFFAAPWYCWLFLSLQSLLIARFIFASAITKTAIPYLYLWIFFFCYLKTFALLSINSSIIFSSFFHLLFLSFTILAILFNFVPSVNLISFLSILYLHLNR